MKHPLSPTWQLPSNEVLEKRLQSLAMLDAILMAEWEMRYFSFNSKWGTGEKMASMRDGEGSEFFFLFSPAGAAGKIFCKEAARPVHAAILEKLPSEFSSFAHEPAFNLENITFCLWRRTEDQSWSIFPPQPNGLPLLAHVGDGGEYYQKWAKWYYECSVPLASVVAIFEHRPLTGQLVTSLNEQRNFAEIAADAEEIGYPFAD